MENKSLKDLEQEVRESAEFISLVIQTIERCDLEAIFPKTLGDYLAGYAVCVKTQKGIFPITILSDNCERSLLYFVKIRDYISRKNYRGVIVTKKEFAPAHPTKIEVDLYNESNKENKIHLISGTNEKELEDKLLKVLK